MGLKIDHLLRNLSDQISMLYTTNNEVRMVNGEKEVFEYDRLTSTGQRRYSRGATSNMNRREWANSRIKLKLLACITRRYRSVET
jgi:hypothetical protein